MALTRDQSWVRAVTALFPGAKAYVEVRGWMDPRPEYLIVFRNGKKFSGFDPKDVSNEAGIYAHGIFRLTGKFP